MKKYEAIYNGYVCDKPKVGWTSDTDIKEKLTRVDLSQDSIEAGGIPIVSDGNIAYIDAGDSHTAVKAVSGMKKSICVFMPLIYILAKASENMVITDPKGELFSKMAPFLLSKGYGIRCIDFRTMEKDGYNILSYPAKVYRSGEEDRALILISDLINVLADKQRLSGIDPFWPDTAAMYLNATASIILDAYPVEAINICSWAELNTFSNAQLLNEIINDVNVTNAVTLNLKSCLSEPEKTLCSTLITASSLLSPFIQNPKVARMLSKSTFDLEELTKNKTALFIITDETTTTCNEIVGIIISQIQSFLVDKAFKTGGRLKTRTNFLLDEFLAFSFSQSQVDVSLATHRSRGIRYYLCLQSLSALKKRYPSCYESILANCANTLFLGSTEMEMLEKISEQCGKAQVTVDGKEEPLISPAELMDLKKSWYYKEGIFMNLSESLRYCVNLPSIEKYNIGNYPAPIIKNKIPNLEPYSLSKFMEDMTTGRTNMPFKNNQHKKETENKKKKKNNKYDYFITEDSESVFDKEEFEKQFNQLFNSVTNNE